MAQPQDPESVEPSSIELKLKDRFKVENDDDADMRTLNTKAKQALVALMRFVPGSVQQILDASITDEQELQHLDFCSQQASKVSDHRASVTGEDADKIRNSSVGTMGTLASLQETLRG